MFRISPDWGSQASGGSRLGSAGHMDQNPYESSAAAYPVDHSGGANRSSRSLAIYFLATAIVIALWAIALLSLYFLTSPTIEDGNVWAQVSPTTTVYTSIPTALAALGIFFTTSIAIVNGLVFFWRRR